VAPAGKTKAAYEREMMYEARIPIMRDWADFCVPPSTASTGNDDKVVALRKSA
jgi:hypothetical protein